MTGGLVYSQNKGQINPYVIAHFVIFFLTVIFFESLYRKYSRMEVPIHNVENVMTLQKFKERVAHGDSLVLLDDLVLDITSYKSQHPGGKFSLE